MFVGENYYDDSVYFLNLLKGKVVSGVVVVVVVLHFSMHFVCFVMCLRWRLCKVQCTMYNHEYAVMLTLKA